MPPLLILYCVGTSCDLQAKLKDVQARIAELEATFARTQAQKEQLARDVEVCRARLVRAQKLVGGLGGEKDR